MTKDLIYRTWAVAVAAMAGAGCEELPDPAASDTGPTMEVDPSFATNDAGGDDLGLDGGRFPVPTDGMDAGSVTPGDGAIMDAEALGAPSCADLACGMHAACVEGDALADAGIDGGTGGTARCVCDEGYMGDGLACVRDECVPLPGAPPTCDEHEVCTDPTGAIDDFACDCEPGYDEDDSGRCVRNECTTVADEMPACGEHTSCVDEGVGMDDFVCLCDEGYTSCDGSDPVRACETHVAGDPDNCGRCGFACAGALGCGDGTCEQAAWRLRGGAGIMCAFIGSKPADEQGPVKCWGGYDENLITNRNSGSIAVPTTPRLIGQQGIVEIGFSDAHACYISPLDDYVRCWGNSLGLGKNEEQTASTTGVYATRVPGAKQLALGLNHTCVLARDGRLSCWGAYSALGLGGTGPDREYPTEVIDDAAQVESTLGLTCVRHLGGEVSCWHDNETPTKIKRPDGSVLQEVEDIAVGGGNLFRFGCALTQSGGVYCWDRLPILDNSATPTYPTAAEVVVPADEPLGMVAGEFHVCVLDAVEGAYCWGINLFRSVDPTQLTGGTSYAEGFVAGTQGLIGIEATAASTCGRRNDGQVVCWGSNEQGQLADRTFKARECVREVSGLPAEPPPSCP